MIISKIVKPILFIVGLALIVAFAAAWVGAIISLFFGQPFLEYLLPTRPWLASLGISSAFVAIGVPFLMLFLMVARLAFGSRLGTGWKVSLWVLWWISITALASIGGMMWKEFKVGNQAEYQINTSANTSDTLRLALGQPVAYNDWAHFEGDGHFSLTVGQGELFVSNNFVEYETTTEPNFTIRIVKYARGSDNQEALSLAEAIETDIRLENGVLHIPYDFTIAQGSKFRAQQIGIYIGVPAGKYAAFNSYDEKRLVNHFPTSESEDHPHFWSDDHKVWQMTETGFINPEWLGQNMDMNETSYQDFSKISVRGRIRVIVQKADKYGFRLQGSKNSTQHVEVHQVGDLLTIALDENNHWADVSVYINAPNVSEIRLKNTKNSKITGFSEKELSLDIASRERTQVVADVEHLTLNLSQRGRVELTGYGNEMTVRAKERVNLNAEHYVVKKANVNAERHGHANLNIMATDTVFTENKANIDVTGGAIIIIKEEKKEEQNAQ